MSKLISVRLHERVLRRLDRERKRAGLSRAGAINEALELWLARRHYDQTLRRDQEGYARHPVTGDEFESLLSAAPWNLIRH